MANALPEPRARVGVLLDDDLVAPSLRAISSTNPSSSSTADGLAGGLDEEARRDGKRGALIGVDHAPSSTRRAARAGGSPGPRRRLPVATRQADSRSSNESRAATVRSGIPCSRRVSSVITASVPSEPDQQPCEVVAGRGLRRGAPGADDRAVREHRFECEHLGAHLAEAQRRRPRGVRRRHPTERRVGARVDREPQAVLAGGAAEGATRHARPRPPPGGRQAGCRRSDPSA